MSLGMTYSPTVPGGGAASYKLWLVFTYSNGYWKVCRRLQGDSFGLGVGLRKGGYVGGSFLGGICHGGRKTQWKGPQDFLALLLKNDEKIFRTEIIKHMKGSKNTLA